jgi:hypothetical protein
MPGSQIDIGMAGIEMSPSNPGMGQMKLSKSCIQEIGIRDLKETMKTKLGWAPYRVSFYPNVVREHLLIGHHVEMSLNISPRCFTRSSGVILSWVS